MRATQGVIGLVLAACLSVAGCANGGSAVGGGLTTSSIPKSQQRVDPACVTLSARIDALRQEGTVGRVEKAATGRSKTVVIKRAALSKVAELNQAQGQFQAKCSTIAPAQRTARVAPAVTKAVANKVTAKVKTAATAAAAKAAIKAAKKK